MEDISGQVSTELILLMACIMMIVLVSISMYRDYLEEFALEINDTEVDILKNKIDKINNLLD
ncbi:MAG: hypothetical protein E7Z85_01045 [Methanosphaera stadtmanae]|nr:hypothetical protein [Methanosphaera stadtmanae]